MTEIFAPTDAEQVAKIVSQAASSGTTLDLRGGGSKVAAPIARDLLLATQKRDPANREDAPETKSASVKSEDI